MKRLPMWEKCGGIEPFINKVFNFSECPDNFQRKTTFQIKFRKFSVYITNSLIFLKSAGMFHGATQFAFPDLALADPIRTLLSNQK